MEKIQTIIKDIIELNNLIDKKCIEINKINSDNNIKIITYKNLMENIILEYHNVCKEKLIK